LRSLLVAPLILALLLGLSLKYHLLVALAVAVVLAVTAVRLLGNNCGPHERLGVLAAVIASLMFGYLAGPCYECEYGNMLRSTAEGSAVFGLLTGAMFFGIAGIVDGWNRQGAPIGRGLFLWAFVGGLSGIIGAPICLRLTFFCDTETVLLMSLMGGVVLGEILTTAAWQGAGEAGW
jgi:hypothetical protein